MVQRLVHEFNVLLTRVHPLQEDSFVVRQLVHACKHFTVQLDHRDASIDQKYLVVCKSVERKIFVLSTLNFSRSQNFKVRETSAQKSMDL